MNLNERLSVDSYFSHIRQTNQLFSNYMTILERQENNLNRLLNNRNLLNQPTNTTRWRSHYPSRSFTGHDHRRYVRWLNENYLPSNRLTNNEIDRLTNVCNFSSVTNPINTSCPITFEEFSPNDRVIVINYCRHIFNENSLRSWFTYNTHCPLCRHNLRENTYTSPYISNQNQINDISENQINDISNNLDNVFENMVNLYSNDNMNTGETITTLSRGTIYNNTTDQTLHDLSNNTQHILNQWNENIINQLSNLIHDDISGNIQLEYRMYSS